jgi:hypothetical protein
MAAIEYVADGHFVIAIHEDGTEEEFMECDTEEEAQQEAARLNTEIYE